MKRIIFLIYLIQATISLFAQPGIESVYVEKFYVVTKKDVSKPDFSGPISEGACTYRIYLDLMPGYRFQAAYGIKAHPLVLKSSAMFYNHVEYGNSQPNVIPFRTLSKNISLLDSWLSVGAANESSLGIPRKFDQESIVNFESGFFQNTTGETSLSFRESDGMVAVPHCKAPTFYQMDEQLKMLNSLTRSNIIEIENGAWACMGKGACGADSLGTNMVLIGQLTTAGDLTYSLNVMVSGPDGVSTKYVYANPQDDEILLPCLQGHADVFKGKKVKSRKKRNNKEK
jgi:hypothetical protein